MELGVQDNSFVEGVGEYYVEGFRPPLGQKVSGVEDVLSKISFSMARLAIVVPENGLRVPFIKAVDPTDGSRDTIASSDQLNTFTGRIAYLKKRLAIVQEIADWFICPDCGKNPPDVVMIKSWVGKGVLTADKFENPAVKRQAYKTTKERLRWKVFSFKDILNKQGIIEAIDTTHPRTIVFLKQMDDGVLIGLRVHLRRERGHGSFQLQLAFIELENIEEFRGSLQGEPWRNTAGRWFTPELQSKPIYHVPLGQVDWALGILVIRELFKQALLEGFHSKGGSILLGRTQLYVVEYQRLKQSGKRKRRF